MLAFFRSRMFTYGFRFFAALSVLALLAAFVTALTTSHQSAMNAIVGPITMGWKGGVGNHLAYTLFVALAFTSGALALMLVAFRDADPDAQMQLVHVESIPMRRAPSGANFVPVAAAFAVGTLAIGAITNRWVILLGLLFLFGVIGLWVLRSWAERATGDDEMNKQLYHRFVDPFRVPVVAVIVVAVLVVGLSRVLLAVNKTSAVVIFAVVAGVFLLVGALLAARPKIRKGIVPILLFFTALALIIAGTIAAVHGERKFKQERGMPTVRTEQGPAQLDPTGE